MPGIGGGGLSLGTPTLMETLQAILTIEWLILALLVAALGDKLKPLANFVLRMCGRKPMNGSTSWITLGDYNNRRPDWFIEWEKRHDKTHSDIGSSIREVKEGVNKVSEKVESMSEAVIRIDERTKHKND